MRKFLLACILWLGLSSQAMAVDFTIHDATISGTSIDVTSYLGSTSNYYLQGALRSTSGDYFFGETQNNRGDWIDYVSSAEKEYIINNFYVTQSHDPTWTNIVHLRFRVDDPNYKGPGEYQLELRRFTGGGKTSAGESNILVINLTAPTPVPSPTSTPASTPPSASASTPTPTPTPTSTPKPSPTVKPSPSPVELLSEAELGTVAGESTEIDLSDFGLSPSPSPTLQGLTSKGPPLNKARAKTALLVGFGLILTALAGFLGYRHYLRTKQASDL